MKNSTRPLLCLLVELGDVCVWHHDYPFPLSPFQEGFGGVVAIFFRPFHSPAGLVVTSLHVLSCRGTGAGAGAGANVSHARKA
jgi:hypothetical protein